jgi:predicted HicB family RNase H-like nuclease
MNQDETKLLNLRLDEPLHRQLTAEAKRSVRSLNGEIIFRLRQSIETQQPDEPAA